MELIPLNLTQKTTAMNDDDDDDDDDEEDHRFCTGSSSQLLTTPRANFPANPVLGLASRQPLSRATMADIMAVASTMTMRDDQRWFTIYFRNG